MKIQQVIFKNSCIYVPSMHSIQIMKKRDHKYEKEEAQWKVLEGAKGIEETV